jgi:hypothetical protein
MGVRWAEHAVRMRERRVIYRVLVGSLREIATWKTQA